MRGSAVNTCEITEFCSGADEVIAEIKRRKPVMGLILGHNCLRDDGCVRLFEYLCSDERQHAYMQEIALNNTQLGDRGLLAIAKYLYDNKGLKELQLQNVREPRHHLAS